jgi:formylglycine-generating enzyme required for sulfatase activity
MKRTFALVIVLAWAISASAITIETVPVGNLGNAGVGSVGLGSVSYNFRIGKYEVTNAQYVEFLNDVDPTGANTLALYNTSMESDARGGILHDLGAPNGSQYSVKPNRNNNPVDFVNWYDSIRFANWMHNGMGDGDTEVGAYTLGALGGDGVPINGSSITRNPAARWWLPSESEWYKAAYHKNDGVTGNYWNFATRSNSQPSSDPPPGGSNSANFGLVLGTVTDVGAYLGSPSPYGTFDQAGNVWEWNERLIGGERVTRGGSYSGTSSSLLASTGVTISPTHESAGQGFRIASIPVPEPSTMLLSTAALAALPVRRRKSVPHNRV